MDDRTVQIAILDDYQGAAQRYFPIAHLESRFGAQTTIYEDHAASEDELIARAGSADIIIAMRERSPLPASVIDRLERTRLIVTTGARNAAIDGEAARARGITLCGAGDTDPATAELTWALLMAVARRIPQEDAGVRAGHWGLHVGEHLHGKTLGILGIGTIGTMVARYAQAFGMHVVATSRSFTAVHAAALGVEAVDRDSVFRQADFLSVHLRLTPETRGSIGWRELGIMKDSAFLINTARGPLIEEDALVRALQSGKIRGAALDVHNKEPLPADSPLLELDNVVLTPHVGYVTEERYASYYGQAGESVEYFLAGNPIRVIN